jgi:hypothetical protein
VRPRAIAWRPTSAFLAPHRSSRVFASGRHQSDTQGHERLPARRYGRAVAFLRRAARRRAVQRLLKISAAAPAMTQPTDPPWRWVLSPTASNIAPTAGPIRSWRRSIHLVTFERLTTLDRDRETDSQPKANFLLRREGSVVAREGPQRGQGEHRSEAAATALGAVHVAGAAAGIAWDGDQTGG